MRFKFTFFLLVLNLVVFGLIIYLSDRASKNAGEDQSLASIIAKELTEADKIVLEAESLSESRVLEKTGTTWNLEKPMRWPANQFAVNRILNQLQFIEDEASFSIAELTRNGQSLSDYGLEPPSISLTIFEGSEPFRLGFGTLTEIGNNVYVLGPRGKRVYVVNRASIDGLLLSLSDLRKREIFEIPVFEVQELSLQIRSTESGATDDLKVRLAKKKGIWGFEAPLTAQANPAQVSNTINTLATVTVTQFLSEADTENLDTGLDNPFMRVTLYGNKRRQTLLIGDSTPENELGESQYFAKVEGNAAVFTIGAGPFDDLREAQEALRERNFVDFASKAIDSIYISESERQTRLQRIENGSWQVLESNDNGRIEPHRADNKVVEDLIAGIQRLRAAEFAVDSPTSVDLERLGFNTPRRIVDILFDGGEKLRLEIAHPEDENKKLYARTDQAEFIYEVDRRTTLRALPLNGLHYRNRTLSALPKSASILGIQIFRGNDSTPLINLERQNGESPWESLKTDFNEAEQNAVTVVEQSIRKFQVKRYLKDFFNDSYPLEADNLIPWKYRVVASVLYPGSEDEQIRKVEYYLTKRLSGTSQIGGSRENSSMFEIRQNLIEALYTLTESFDLPPEATSDIVPNAKSIETVPEPAPSETK